MAWPGFFLYNGTEIINASRTEAYAAHFRKGWFRPVYGETDLAWLLGDSEYSSPLQDDAPWTDPDNLDSYDFYGAYPLTVTGIEDSTVSATITESVIDGGFVGRVRRTTREIVYTAVLAGASECATEFGLRWLRTVLNAGPCFNQVYGVCGGADLCYLACPPVFGDPPPTYSPGPIVTDDTNRATNPNAEVGADSGWYSNDPAKWVISAPTANPISGTHSVMSTRAMPNIVTQGANGTFEGGNITGFNGSVTLAPSTTVAHSGTGSLKLTYITGNNYAYVNLTNLVVGQVYTAECWLYVPSAPNLLTSGANGTFEGGVITGWAGIGTAPPTIAADATTKHSGSHSLKTTWATSGSFEAGVQTTTGFPTVVGQQYTAEAWLYIPTGSAQASIYADPGVGNVVTVKDQWALSTVTFTATTPTTYVGVYNRADTTAGQLCYVDDVRLVSASANSIAAQPYLDIDGGSNKSPKQIVTTPDTWVKSSMTFTATLTSDYIYTPLNAGPPVAGMVVYVDDVKVTKASDLDATASSMYFQSSVSVPFSVTPGVPITLGIDVKVEQANRLIYGYFAWVGGPGGASPGVSIPAGAPGDVVRFTMTATPPAGVTTAYPVVNTQARAGNASVGERVWLDNLYVGTDPSGDYYDGSTPANGDYSYGWNGAPNASTSHRNVQTYVQDPDPTSDDCYDRVGRSMHEVTTTVGPNVTAKMTMQDGSEAWTVTWTMVAANPAEFGVERPLVIGFLDPNVDNPYAGGVTPEGGDYDEDGTVQSDPSCPVVAYKPVFDPTCVLLVPPPDVPTVVPTCFTFPVNYRRRSFSIPRDDIPLWTEVVPIISLSTKAEARSVRVRFYADVFGTGNPTNDPCNYCGDVVFSYIPASSTIVLNCADQQVYIDTPGIGRRRADSLVSDSKGNPFEWPQFSCGFGYVVTVDTPQQMTTPPILDLSLVPRVI